MTSTSIDEADLIAALRARDEVAFASLVDQHAPAMLRVARGYVGTHEAAEEVVQEAWIALLKGIDGFQGRSSLRTWLFTVLINIAKKRGLRDRSDVDVEIAAYTGGTVDPKRFRDNDDQWPGHWKDEAVPHPFPETPEGSVLGQEMRAVTRRELDKLPERQRLVVTMRDMLDMDAAEVSRLMEITAANQRVLLHRGRAAVRAALEDYLRETV
ncbi:RNA polymerase sigma-70 factor (ECF subfamily) [Mycolicibacterium iranicum]|uniref:RNA polymerase sigma-70 factor (ECF subfamily) n=1 Tax=Mycolicibacterium iranicum TaxID=912594 RepID=A0A839PZH0_MYCIR|nr:sigma-70 family RNA polymerase sigma factor [Mycolicibacterium iranicum]MBB2989390.1 RNA polymerase sigma-70 factor (ECF subfamily) [Mycolicibacterium iranicum]